MSYYIDNKQTFLAEIKRLEEELKQQVGSIRNDEAESNAKQILENEQQQAKKDRDEYIREIDNNLASTLNSVAEGVTQSVVLMPPYQLQNSAEKYAYANIVLKEEAAPKAEMVLEQAEKRIYLPKLPIGTRSYTYTGKPYILPVYIDWQSEDSVKPGNMLIEYEETEKSQAMDVADSIIYRILMAFPPGKVHVTLLDPTQMGGQNVTKDLDSCQDLFHGKVFNGKQETKKAFTQLTNRIPDIKKAFERGVENAVTHNIQKNTVELGYELIVLYNPFNNRPDYFEDLANILTNGNTAGMYVLIIQGRANEKREYMKELPLNRFSHIFIPQNDAIQILEIDTESEGKEFLSKNSFSCHYFQSSNDGLISPIDLHKLDLLIKPFFELVANRLEDVNAGKNSITWDDWKGEYADGECFTQGISVPIGRNIDTDEEVCYRTESSSTTAHTFIMGKTGSGKSKLLSAILSSITMKYSPKAIELYLLDFKDGSTFKAYKGVPHANWVVTTAADKTMLLTILDEIEQKIIFRRRNLGMTQYEEYNQEVPPEKREPRIFLFVDECQDLFSRNVSKITDADREISAKLREFARKNRSAGFHLILASQTIPNEMDWITEIENNFLLKAEGSSTQLLGKEYNGSEIQLRLALLSNTVFSRRESKYTNIYAYPDYKHAYEHIIERAERLLKEEYLSFSKKVKEWNGVFTTNFTEVPISCPMEFGVDTFGQKSIGVFVDGDKTNEDNGHVLLYGLRGEGAQSLTMRVLLSTLRGQIFSRKMAESEDVSPAKLYIINAWNKGLNKTRSRWNKSNENEYIADGMKLLNNLNQDGFITIVPANEIGTILLPLQEEIKNHTANPTLVYILGTNEIDFWNEFIEPELKESQKKEGVESWRSESSGYHSTNKRGQTGKDVLKYILEKGANDGVAVVMHIEGKKDLEILNLSSELFKYMIFQQAPAIRSWDVNLDDMENNIEDLPIDKESGRVIFYEPKSAVERLVIPFQLDELLDVAARNNSVGQYVLDHCKIKETK